MIFSQSRVARRCSSHSRCSSALRVSHVVPRAVQTGEAEISTKDVAKLLDTLTQPDMTIAELHMVSGDLEIRVRRKLEADVPVAAAPVAAAAAARSAYAAAPEPHMQPALQLAPAPWVSMDDFGAEESMDESLLYVTANRVGVFRRGKSKSKVGDQVKKGQILGAIEQLGTVVDVKSPQDGEIVAYKVKDGEPVEFGGHIVALAPYFNLEDAGKTQLRGIN